MSYSGKASVIDLNSSLELNLVENLRKECQWFYRDLPNYDLSDKEVELTQQSYIAFKCDEEQHPCNREKIAQMLNGDIVTDSESDNPDRIGNKKES